MIRTISRFGQALFPPSVDELLRLTAGYDPLLGGLHLGEGYRVHPVREQAPIEADENDAAVVPLNGSVDGFTVAGGLNPVALGEGHDSNSHHTPPPGAITWVW